MPSSEINRESKLAERGKLQHGSVFCFLCFTEEGVLLSKLIKLNSPLCIEISLDISLF